MTSRKFLFIHQNFPGQFVHVVTALVRMGHEVVALGINGRTLEGVHYIRYAPQMPLRASDVQLLRDMESKVIRGEACALAMDQLKVEGFEPDTIIAHPGWGEALFCKDVWPRARLIIFAEFFYRADGADFNFDPEFAHDSRAARSHLRLKNSVHLHAMEAADVIYTPTQWQCSQLPQVYRQRTHVIFDGIDTRKVAPDPTAFLHLRRNDVSLRPGDEVITFVNRNLEPYRGFHTFMRALPAILRARPNARCILIGRDGVSYGALPRSGGNWKDLMLREVGHLLPMDRVHFLGALPYEDYLKVLQVSACHVYLTYPFVLSWSCLEAMSAGCVVLGSDTAPVREVIQHGFNGVLTDFFEIPAIAAQVVDVLARSSHYKALGVEARRSVVERFDLQDQCLPALINLVLSS